MKPLALAMVASLPLAAAAQDWHGIHQNAPTIILPYPQTTPSQDIPTWNSTHWSNGVTTYSYVWIGGGRYIQCLTDNNTGNTRCSAP